MAFREKEAPGRRRGSLIALALAVCVVVPALAGAEPPTLTPVFPNCVPVGSNGLASLQVVPELGWGSVRAYFRAHGSQDFYFMEMRRTGDGTYWVPLPVPASGVASIDLYYAVRDANGTEFATDTRTVPASSTCDAALEPDAVRLAKSLVVGETAATQTDMPLVGWTCNGVISRLSSSGKLYADSYCRQLMFAELAQPRIESGTPMAARGGSTTVETSPGTRPPMPVIRPRDREPNSPSPP